MKTITLNVLKKNRVYFKCQTQSGFTVKLRIDSASESLHLGEQELLVRDVSVRTKYGVDIIYELEAAIKKDERKVALQHATYNSELVKKCKELGGKWDGEAKAWVFSSIVEDGVEELDFKYNTNLVDVEITATTDLSAHTSSVTFFGYTIARATGRDSGATLGDNVCMVNGHISSGGSVKNWSTEIRSGSVFRLSISENLLEVDSNWSVRVLGDEYEKKQLLIKDAQTGCARLNYSDEEIYQAAKHGLISASDAMNQDF